jgi:eukaryotic-like serine/threonine-protein kinase
VPQTLRPGQLLDGRYVLIDRIGRGGMSTVWRARDERLGRIAAVKVLAAELLADEASRDRLRVEAQALARLHHPHIADVYDYGTDDIPFLVMELVGGVPLSQALADGRELPWTEAASVAAQVAAALAAAHRRGLVHRDITAGNILLTADGVKVIDFGICESEGTPESEMLLGTPAYLAPERIAGRPVQPESDVYSLGVLLYRMLAGEYPFTAETAKQLMLAHRDQPPPPLPEVEGMPPVVAEICMSCLAKDPAERPSAREISRKLFDLLGGAIAMPAAAAVAADEAMPTHLLPWPESTPQTAPGAAPTQFSRPARTVLAASALLVVAVAGLAAAKGWEWGTPSTPQAAAGPAAQQAATCAVTYQALRDSGRSFQAAVTVANLGDSDVADGRLTFDLPDTQKLSVSDVWQQSGHRVVNRPGLLKLPARRGLRLPLSGSYSGTNAYPLSFQLDGKPCQVSVLGPSGTPVGDSPAQPSRTVVVDVSPSAAAKGPAASPPSQPQRSPAPPSPSSAPVSPGPGDPSPTAGGKVSASMRPQGSGASSALSTSDLPRSP